MTAEPGPVVKVPACIVCAGTFTLPNTISLPVAIKPKSNTVCKSPVATVTKSIIPCIEKFLVGLPFALTSVPNTRSVLSGITVGYE